MKITVIEPSWDGLAHCPANLGALQIFQHAYPTAKIYFAAGQRHLNEIIKIAPKQLISKIEHIPFSPELDKDTLPNYSIRTLLKIRKLPRNILRDSDLIVQTSCTASSLTAFNWLGLSSKTVTFLHGNANELSGWRSKNPLRRMFDFVSSLKEFANRGGKVLVYENTIKENLTNASPWLNDKIFTLGHPLIEEESKLANINKILGNPIRIAFAGNATISKGFPEFVKIAQQIQNQLPGKYEFHSIGNLHSSCRDIDQSALSSQAGVSFPRDKFIQKIASMDFIFTWHSDDYYSNAASGIVYDAINLGIPLIARKTAFLESLENQGTPIAITFNNTKEIIETLLTKSFAEENYIRLISNLAINRKKNSTEQLALDLLAIMSTDTNSRTTPI